MGTYASSKFTARSFAKFMLHCKDVDGQVSRMNSFSADGPPVVAVAANSSFNIINFRLELIHCLEQAGYRVLVIAPAARTPLAAHAVAAKDWTLSRSGLNPIRDLRALWQLRSYLKSAKVSVFLSFTVKPNIYGALACRLIGIPAIPNVSGLGTVFMTGGTLERLVTWLYRLSFRHCPVVMFQNPDDLDLFLAKRIVRRNQAVVLPGSGIDLVKFQPTTLPDGPPTFLLIARLLRDKGIREFVEAARLLKKEHPDWRFQLLGPLDPDNRSGFRQAEIDRWLDEGVIEYLGQTDDIRPAIAAASAIVLPSYREGLPRTLLEGAAMARPLVATDVPGCRELLIEGVTGLFCKPRDPVSLANAMQRIGKLPATSLATMGTAARRLAEEKFSIERVNSLYLDVVNHMMAAKETID